MGVRRLSSRSFSGPVFAAVAALVVWAGAGCGSDGTLKLSWTFAGEAEVSALTCAQRGVFSVFVAGATGGDGASTEVPCASGLLTW